MGTKWKCAKKTAFVAVDALTGHVHASTMSGKSAGDKSKALARHNARHGAAGEDIHRKRR